MCVTYFLAWDETVFYTCNKTQLNHLFSMGQILFNPRGQKTRK